MSDAKKKILIIEDEKPLANALMLKLTHAGYEAEIASDGQEGLDLLEKGGFALALCDLIMPRVNGFTVLETVKNKQYKTPVIILTNLNQAEDEKRARELGAADFFVKSNTPVADIVTHVQQKIGSA